MTEIPDDVEMIARALNMRLHNAKTLGQRTLWIAEAILADRAGRAAAAPSPQPNLRVWTQADAERENVAFTEWFKQRGYPDYPDLYSLTTENAMHAAWQEAAKRAALATEGK